MCTRESTLRVEGVQTEGRGGPEGEELRRVGSLFRDSVDCCGCVYEYGPNHFGGPKSSHRQISREEYPFGWVEYADRYPLTAPRMSKSRVRPPITTDGHPGVSDRLTGYVRQRKRILDLQNR